MIMNVFYQLRLTITCLLLALAIVGCNSSNLPLPDVNDTPVEALTFGRINTFCFGQPTCIVTYKIEANEVFYDQASAYPDFETGRIAGDFVTLGSEGYQLVSDLLSTLPEQLLAGEQLPTNPKIYYDGPLTFMLVQINGQLEIFGLDIPWEESPQWYTTWYNRVSSALTNLEAQRP